MTRANRVSVWSADLTSHRLLLWAILIGAAFLRFYRLDHSSLWHDEGNTWALMGHTFSEIARRAAADIHPPGYYWLLKLWSLVGGRDAYALRSFSALAGVMLVWVVYRLAHQIAALQQGAQHRAFSLLAAFVTATNPFQVYYSQEARMYALLALESVGLFGALLAMLDTAPVSLPKPNLLAAQRRGWLSRPAIFFVLCAVAGLWTHYSFPIVLLAAGLIYLVGVLLAHPFQQAQSAPESQRERAENVHPPPSQRPPPIIGKSREAVQWMVGKLFFYALLNLIALAAFLPWLPTALERVHHWPHGGESVSLGWALWWTLQTFVFGPLHSLPQPQWPWLVGGLILPLLGLWSLRPPLARALLLLWLAPPIGLMIGLGLYSDAFLKFLLIASPAWCMATAAVIGLPKSIIWSILVTLGAISLAWLLLPAYYNDSMARDNYAGVARYLQVVGDPGRDLVILNAPGQQEVWRYYDPGLPVLALPQERPPAPTQTVATLTAAVTGRRQIYALFWATDESDPGKLVEGWLDRHTFKGVESWQGNLRFVTYSLPNQLHCQPVQPLPSFGGEMMLREQCQPAVGQPVQSGQVALIGLRWQALTTLTRRYKVSVQLLDARNQVIAQHDAEPGGGSAPTDGWRVGEEVVDNHGLFIPFGVPPGDYRMVLIVYEPTSGQRLSTAAGEWLELGLITVERLPHPPPPEILPAHYRLERLLGSVRLVGYDRYRKGYAHTPETPVPVGELVHFTFYWQAPDPLPANWPADLHFSLQMGSAQIEAPLAGGSYPTQAWRAGELVRGEFDLLYDGSSVRPVLLIGGEQAELARLP